MLAAFHLIDSLENLNFNIQGLQQHYKPSLSDLGNWNCYVAHVTSVLYGEAATLQQRDEVALFLKLLTERGVSHRFLPAVLHQRIYVDSLGKPLTDAIAAGRFLRQCLPSGLMRRGSLEESPAQSTSVEDGPSYAVTSGGRTLRSSIAARFRCDVASTTVEFDGKQIEIKSKLERQLLRELIERDGEMVFRAQFEAKHGLREKHVYGNLLRSLKKRFPGVIQTVKGPGGGCYLAETPRTV